MKTPKRIFIVLDNEEVQNLSDEGEQNVYGEKDEAGARETAIRFVTPEGGENLEESATQTVYELVPVFRAHRAARPKFYPAVKTTNLRKNKNK